MDRSGTGSRHRRTSSISHRLRLADHNVDVLDSLSSASLMEVTAKFSRPFIIHILNRSFALSLLLV